MKLKSNYFANYNGFTLDPAQVVPHSEHKRKLWLPYNGELPKQFEGTTNPRLTVNVRPLQEMRVALRADSPTEEAIVAGVDAEPQEIIAILDRMFTGDYMGKTGLSRYWEGIFCEDYSLWREFVKNPRSLRSIFAQLDKQGRALVKELAAEL